MRHLLKLVTLLILGVTITVATAWAGALWGPHRADDHTIIGKPAGGLPLGIPPDMGETRTSTMVWTTRCIGCDYEMRMTETGTVGVCSINIDREVMVCRAGWPIRSLCGTVFDSNVPQSAAWIPVGSNGIPNQLSLFRSTTATRGLPYQPLWPAFIAATAGYAAFFGLLAFAPSTARRALRRRRAQCEHCAYPIGSSPICTECGSKVTPRVEMKTAAT